MSKNCGPSAFAWPWQPSRVCFPHQPAPGNRVDGRAGADADRGAKDRRGPGWEVVVHGFLPGQKSGRRHAPDAGTFWTTETKATKHGERTMKKTMEWLKAALGFLADAWWALTMAEHLHDPADGICIGYQDNRDGRRTA